MQAHSSSENTNTRAKSKDATILSEKEKLLRDIQDLKCIIKQCEWNLNTLRFKEVEERTTELQSSRTPSNFGRIPNVEFDLQSDLYKFAGFRCVKFRRNEIIFNFTLPNKQQEDNTYALQIFIKDGKAKLGKWVMPMSVDMNYILTKTPIDELKNLTTFIKSCKHNIDCYVIRKEQFLSLKKHTLHMKYCSLHSNLGYTQISLELHGVHDNENDRHINLMIYLLYYSDKARPYKIECDTMNESKLSNDIKQKLKECLKEFKISDLQTAFDRVLAEENSTFTWMLMDNSESPLELNDTSNSSEEGFLVQLRSDKRKSLRSMKRKRELQEKWSKRKRQNITGNKTLEDSTEDSQSAAKVSHVESLLQIPKRGKKTKKIPFLKQQEKINENLLEETTPVQKSRVRLKQTKLNFQTNKDSQILRKITDSLNTNKVSPIKSKLSNVSEKKLRTRSLITSTPLHQNVRRTRKISSSSSLEIDNITNIEILKKTVDKSNSINNSSHLENKMSPEKKTTKLLRSSVKSTGPASRSRILKKKSTRK